MSVVAKKLHLPASYDMYGVMKKVLAIFDYVFFKQNYHLWRHNEQNSVKIQSRRGEIIFVSTYMDVAAIKLFFAAS